MEQIRKLFRQAGFALYLGTVLLLLLGLLMVIRPDILTVIVCRLIGLVFVCFGLRMLIRFATKSRDRDGNTDGVSAVLGVMLIVVGFYLIVHPEILAGIAGVLLAVFLLGYALTGLIRILRSRTARDIRWWLSLLAAVILLVLGCAFLVTPVSGSLLIVRIAGIALLYATVSNLLFGIRIALFAGKAKKKAREVRDSLEEEVSRRTGRDRNGKEIIDGTAEILQENEDE